MTDDIKNKQQYKQLNILIPQELSSWLDTKIINKRQTIINLLTQIKDGKIELKDNEIYCQPTWQREGNTAEQQLRNLLKTKQQDDVYIAAALLQLPYKLIKFIKNELLINNSRAFKLYRTIRRERQCITDAKLLANKEQFNQDLIELRQCFFKPGDPTPVTPSKDLFALNVGESGGIVVCDKDSKKIAGHFESLYDCKLVQEVLTSVGFDLYYVCRWKNAEEDLEQCEYELHWELPN